MVRKQSICHMTRSMLLPREDHCDPICVLLLGALYIHGVDMLCQQRGSLGISGLSGCFKGSNRFHKWHNLSDRRDHGILFTVMLAGSALAKGGNMNLFWHLHCSEVHSRRQIMTSQTLTRPIGIHILTIHMTFIWMICKHVILHGVLP